MAKSTAGKPDEKRGAARLPDALVRRVKRGERVRVEQDGIVVELVRAETEAVQPSRRPVKWPPLAKSSTTVEESARAIEEGRE